MNATTENKTETFEPVTFQDVREGDCVRFVTANNGFGSDGGDLWRTGTVTKVTTKTVTVEITGHNPLAEDVFRDGKSRKLGRTARLRQAGWHHRCVSKAVTGQPTTARTATDLPKGTRVKDAEGRMGTVNGVDVGRVTLPDHPNYGREYVGVDWDADEKCPWGDRSRPFVDELAIVTPADTDEAPFQPGERVVHADGRRFTFVGVNPEDSSRILVARPTDGRVVAWLLTDCRAESKAEMDDPLSAVDFGEPRCVHGFVERPADRGRAIKACAEKGSVVSVGVFSDEGCVYAVDCAVQASDEAARLNTEEEHPASDPLYRWAVMCTEHEEQPANGCEECATEGCGAVDADDLDACGECSDCTGRN